MFGSQLVLPGQFLSAPESPSPSFLLDFQGLLAGRAPLQTSHHTTPSPTALPEDLLLSRYVLVRHDAVQPPLSPLYDGPFLVVERSLHFFKIQMDPKSKLFPHIASSLAMPHRMCRPPNRRAEVVRRTPPKDQIHASNRAVQPRSRLQPQVAVVSPSPAHWSPPDRHPSGRPQRRPTAPPVSAAQHPDRRAIPPKNQHPEL